MKHSKDFPMCQIIGAKNINIVLHVGGIRLEIWHPKIFKSTDSTFFKDFRAPYLQRDTRNGNDIYVFCSVFQTLSTGGLHFSAILSSWSNLFKKVKGKQ